MQGEDDLDLRQLPVLVLVRRGEQVLDLEGEVPVVLHGHHEVHLVDEALELGEGDGPGLVVVHAVEHHLERLLGVPVAHLLGEPERLAQQLPEDRVPVERAHELLARDVPVVVGVHGVEELHEGVLLAGVGALGPGHLGPAVEPLLREALGGPGLELEPPVHELDELAKVDAVVPVQVHRREDPAARPLLDPLDPLLLSLVGLDAECLVDHLAQGWVSGQAARDLRPRHQAVLVHVEALEQVPPRQEGLELVDLHGPVVRVVEPRVHLVEGRAQWQPHGLVHRFFQGLVLERALELLFGEAPVAVPVERLEQGGVLLHDRQTLRPRVTAAALHGTVVGHCRG
mmetsp:Transcript_37501/g.83870  ORF Transcript_37501/g.83870 Transcript_37501/m.83870 type:complete len:342 (-) Transcript_37501:45-1070(-)